jgi:hypothetical protein
MYGGTMEGEWRGKGGVTEGNRRFPEMIKCKLLRHFPPPKVPFFALAIHT